MFPDFRWTAQDDAVGYALFVTRSDDRDANAKVVEMSDPQLHCADHADGICSAGIPGLMVDGAQYSWWIGKRTRGQNPDVLTWSDMQTFIYARRKLPTVDMQKADLVSPFGEQNSAVEDRQFYWRNRGASDWFRLLVIDDMTERPTGPARWISASDAGCGAASGTSSGVCTLMHNGYYRSGVEKYCWSITPWNALGLGNPSPLRCFFDNF